MIKASYILTFTRLIFFAIIFAALPLQAATGEARDFIQGIGDNVVVIVKNNKLSDDNKEKQLQDLFVKTVDINWIAKFVAGRYWRESSPLQQEQYLKFYKDFLIGSYVYKFRQYTDQEMVITKFTAEEGDRYIVETIIADKESKSYNVTYKVKKTEDGSFRIYDIIAEGVSMITTQRSEFASILSREGMDALIEKLQKKD